MEVFKLFADCVLTKGVLRSTISDLNRQNYKVIPNELYEILVHQRNKSVSEIKSIYGSENEMIIDEYIDFLIKNDFGFFCNEQEVNFFPDLDLEFDEPNIISNAILDFNRNTSYNYEKIINELSDLSCEYLQIRIYNVVPIQRIVSILDATVDKSLYSIQLLLHYDESLSPSFLEKLFYKYSVESISVHSCPDIVKNKLNNKNFHVYYSEEKISDQNCCGVVHPIYFSPNIKHFSESQHLNTCLNKKLSVDVMGNVKNCPSCAKSFGSADNITLSEIVSKGNFKKKWLINKDQIDICKVCEFRHICTDCRAYVSDYQKPAKCNYNPYTAVWEQN